MGLHGFDSPGVEHSFIVGLRGGKKNLVITERIEKQSGLDAYCKNEKDF
jgi:hypothetical protein